MNQTIAVAAQPILVLILTLGGVAKLATVGTDAEPGALGRLGPAVLAPERFRAPALIFCAVAEFGLAAGLVLVDHPVPRWMTVTFFAVATYVLWDLRRRRPDVGCGCFGEVSARPVGRRAIGRTVLLTGMSVMVARYGEAGLSWPSPIWLAGGVALLLVLSPEIEESMARLRYRAPCEQRPFAAERAFARLRSSAAWRAHYELLRSDQPTDTWRELCWRFFTFEGTDGSDVVFAVYLSGRRPPVRTAVVGADGQRAPLRESIPVSA
ncbi:MauE/DoxX family redox-associated membrane protein [Acrocarpospora catenulata]|uniref:MauE/DoxX family redox-associated membrane protein n=1 Tax=Acrocarpospora catenulata TaxID=2836182 RepID=UPI001BDB03AD|nr:MauE/DoxX family redox-associated membrane protein [Acrocarpospora catenulata]